MYTALKCARCCLHIIAATAVHSRILQYNIAMCVFDICMSSWPRDNHRRGNVVVVVQDFTSRIRCGNGSIRVDLTI